MQCSRFSSVDRTAVPVWHGWHDISKLRSFWSPLLVNLFASCGKSKRITFIGLRLTAKAALEFEKCAIVFLRFTPKCLFLLSLATSEQGSLFGWAIALAVCEKSLGRAPIGL